jgi:hypothetical protein
MHKAPNFDGVILPLGGGSHRFLRRGSKIRTDELVPADPGTPPHTPLSSLLPPWSPPSSMRPPIVKCMPRLACDPRFQVLGFFLDSRVLGDAIVTTAGSYQQNLSRPVWPRPTQMATWTKNPVCSRFVTSLLIVRKITAGFSRFVSSVTKSLISNKFCDQPCVYLLY